MADRVDQLLFIVKMEKTIKGLRSSENGSDVSHTTRANNKLKLLFTWVP